MPVFLLEKDLVFPPVELAEDGLLAVGGDLSPERLVLAYSSGIFPWYEDGQPILWHSPDPRMVLLVRDLKVSRSLRRTLKKGTYDVTVDAAFGKVIEACATVPREGQRGTWITADIRDAYGELHRRGLAHSVEAWRDGELLGGLYGVSLGAAFFGESMFQRSADASKVAFVRLLGQLERWEIDLVDCQVFTPHLARFGAALWPRERYLALLERALQKPTRVGRWSLEPDL